MTRHPFRALVERIIRGDEPPPPVAELIGFSMESVGEGTAVAVLRATSQHANPMGTLHGGILCDLADAAMGIAWSSQLEQGESFTTLELKINFFKPVWEAELRAEASVVRRGKMVGMAECDIRDETGSLVARASSTIITLRGADAEGR